VRRGDTRDPEIPITRLSTMTNEPIVLSVEEACKEIGLSEPTMRRRAADDPNFPRKIKLSVRRVGYLRSDIETYLQRQREQAFAT
jgi:predicted DNA-binding transcriptional regulator AlpA